MILFLDYDGVLHPDPCMDPRRLFENAPRLTVLLEEFPEVGVVLSTSWRNVRTEAEVLDPLPAPLRARIIGCTPRYSDCSGTGARAPFRRQAECEQWLRTHGMAQDPWWALDDRPDWFAPYCENLLECNPHRGFDERMALRLHSVLTVARQRAASGLDLALV